MAQEFTINSSAIESKINQLLPSQGGFGAGVDFSASTMVIPIVDLTETAEGSNVREDLQTALSHGSITSFAVQAASATLINTTGYFRVFGNSTILSTNADRDNQIALNDGATTKTVWQSVINSSTAVQHISENFDFIVFLKAGDSLLATAADSSNIFGCTRQIADISGNLVNPI